MNLLHNFLHVPRDRLHSSLFSRHMQCKRTRPILSKNLTITSSPRFRVVEDLAKNPQSPFKNLHNVLQRARISVLLIYFFSSSLSCIFILSQDCILFFHLTIVLGSQQKRASFFQCPSFILCMFFFFSYVYIFGV